MNWEEFLVYITGPGVGIAVGVVLSFVIEMWPKFDELEGHIKRLVFLVLCFGVPLLGTVAKCVSGLALWNDWTGAWWPAIVAAWVAFGAGQVAHLRKLWRDGDRPVRIQPAGK